MNSQSCVRPIGPVGQYKTIEENIDKLNQNSCLNSPLLKEIICILYIMHNFESNAFAT